MKPDKCLLSVEPVKHELLLTVKDNVKDTKFNDRTPSIMKTLRDNTWSMEYEYLLLI